MTKRTFMGKTESLITDLLKLYQGTRISKEERNSVCYIRAIFPACFEPNPNDKIHHGVAFRINPKKKIDVGPWLYRIVCENGIVVTHEELMKQVDCENAIDCEMRDRLLQAIERCCQPITCKRLEKYVTAATEQPANMRHIFHRLSRFTQWAQRTSLYHHIVQRMDPVEKPTRFDLMNAITSLARDTLDPELKWNLEQLGWEGVTGIQYSWEDVEGSESGELERPLESQYELSRK